MINITKYAENEMRSFDELPFSDVDSLVLSKLSYVHFEGLVPGFEKNSVPVRLPEMLKAENFSKMFRNVPQAEDMPRFLVALVASPRFRDIRMNHYINELDPGQEKQFCAITFFLPSHIKFVAFRGTDNTLVGWKEDFNMAFVSPIPSQTRATEYLQNVAQRVSGSLMLGGHSKGGNLAVYAALTAPTSIQNRIIAIFDHDGPGFRNEILDSEGYRRIEEKVHKTVPEFSFVGMLLEYRTKYSVVDSNRLGIGQHEPFSWKIEDGSFVLTDEISGGARYFNRSLKDWLGGLTHEKRELFVELLFKVLEASEAETFDDLLKEWQKNIGVIFTAMRETDPEMKKFVSQTIREFGSIMMRNLLKKKRHPIGEGRELRPEHLLPDNRS
ncbi:MAG: DUF2974 domain-containing protein [Oscillospiraceae bacterium]